MTHCVINIKDNRLFFSGDVPVDEIRSVTSWRVQGCEFSKAYKSGRWDGTKSVYDKKTNSCPAGLLDLILDHLQSTRPDIDLNVNFTPESIQTPRGALDVRGKLKGKFGVGIYDYQLEAAKAAIEKKRGILKLSTNSGKTACAAAVINYLKLPTLFMVPGVELLYQTVETLSDLLEIPKESIGAMGDGNFTVGEWVTVATADTLHTKLFSKQIPQELQEVKFEVLFCDECHGGSATTWYEVMDVIPATYRIGMSGTPTDRSDGNSLRLIAQTGPIIYEVSNKLLVDRGISVQPLVKLVHVNTPQIPKKRNKKKVTWGEAYDEGITNNLELNIKVVEELVNQLGLGKQVIVMVDRIEHGDNIKELVKRDDVVFIHGQLDSEERSQAIQDFKNGKIRALISTSILNQGVDMDCIDTLILSSGGKALIPLLQRIGRGLRTGKGRDSLLIIDFINNCHKFFIEHSLIRLQTYRDQDCFKLI